MPCGICDKSYKNRYTLTVDIDQIPQNKCVDAAHPMIPNQRRDFQAICAARLAVSGETFSARPTARQDKRCARSPAI